MNKEYKYDVAISFAEEDRDAALALLLSIKLAGFRKVYYYPDKREATWGELLPETLTKIYSHEAQYAVVLLSNHYLDPGKAYTHIELAAIRARARQEPNHIYMLPVKLNDSVTLKAHPDLNQIGHLNWEYNPDVIVQLLKKCLGKRTTGRVTRVTIQNKQYLIIRHTHAGEAPWLFNMKH